MLTSAAFGAISGELKEEHVLVVRNSAHADSEAVWDAYRAVRPGVRGVDLADASLNPGTISYATFTSKIRNPIRAHLNATGLHDDVAVIVLTKGIPHRILDLHSGSVGDQPGNAFSLWQSGKASYASVDSELTLLWQDLESGDTAAAMDSPADNRVLNPYYGKSNRFLDYSRSGLKNSKHFSPSSTRWRMKNSSNGASSGPGDMYLVSRLDGNSVDAVEGMIQRAMFAYYNSSSDYIIQDKHLNGIYDQGNYTLAHNSVSPHWPAFTHEQTNTFVIGANGNLTYGNNNVTRHTGGVAALVGYGGNHAGGNKTGFIQTFAGQMCNGAVYSGFESYNARKFGGVGGFGSHGQLSDWIDAGGTLGIGNVWEPMSDGAPRNSELLEHYFVTGRTWVEAAWSSSYYLSWQTLVLGDPLAKVSFTPPLTASVQATGILSEADGGDAQLTVVLSEPAVGDTDVTLQFAGAEQGSDFRILDGGAETVCVPDGATSAILNLQGLVDDEVEGTETLEVRVAPAVTYMAAATTAEVPIEDRPFAVWVLNRFGVSSPMGGPDADPDGDGLANIIEFALGLDPNARGDCPMAEIGPEGPHYCFTRDPQASDVQLEVEFSPDLSHWSSIAPTKTGVLNGLDHFKAVPPNGATSGYFRLVVELSPSASEF